MKPSIESQLDESFRDALVVYYLGEVVPNSRVLRPLGLDSRLKTANDLYEFFLIDNQVSNDVQTSYVASAISSLQQYINGALLGMEPGQESLRADDARFVEWLGRSSQYPIWAGNMQLALYPEVYISPALRLKKSAYFAQLENDINQNKIHVDTTLDAVNSYLASFEEVANLTVINGYIDSADFARGNYYFIGKSRAENIFYWRSVDMNERSFLNDTAGPKEDYPTPGAWSDWKRMDVGINGNTLERTIRPVFFNNRLFITWVDLIPVTEELESTLPTTKITPDADGSVTVFPPNSLAPQIKTTPKVRIVLNAAYKKYDDSWSTSQTYINKTWLNHYNLLDQPDPERNGKTVEGELPTEGEHTLENELNTVAVFDLSTSPECLFIALYAGESLTEGDFNGTTSTYKFLTTAYIDKSFNIKPSFPRSGFLLSPYSIPSSHPDELLVRKLCWVYALKNKNNLQFTWNTHIAIRVIDNASPDSWNALELQKHVTDMTGEFAPVVNHASSTIELFTGINADIDDQPDIKFTLTFTSNLPVATPFIMTIVASKKSNIYYSIENGSTLKVSSILPINSEFAPSFSPNETEEPSEFLYTKEFGNFFITSEHVNNEELSLAGGYFKADTLEKILSSPAAEDARGWIRLHDANIFISAQVTLPSHTEIEYHSYNQEFHYPTRLDNPFGEQKLISYTNLKDTLTAPSLYTASIPFDKATLRPKFLSSANGNTSNIFYITHGIGIDKKSTNADFGEAKKSTSMELVLATTSGIEPLAPKISKRVDLVLGIAEYIDFTDSSIKFTDGAEDIKRKPIRMNTLFARELINKASIALEALLSWDTQQLREPPIGDETEPSAMDFKGANGLYFWELFLHLPFMVSHRLNLEQRFKDAEFWLRFIFDPGRKATGNRDAYWNVRPLVETSDPDYFMRSPIDPDGIAASDPVKYQKAVYFHYIKNLIDRGDMAYRQLTPDSLGEAKLWYVRILDLLGPRPDVVLSSQWAPDTLDAIAKAKSPGLRAFESQLQQTQSGNAEDTRRANIHQHHALRLSTFTSDPTLLEEDNDRFITPMNAELVQYWDMLESRLYNLRHNLTLDGKPLSLPLFGAPLDPRALLAAYANGSAGGGATSVLAHETPHYRFAVMSSRANAAAEMLIQFGNTLLSIIERQEQGQLIELQQQQAWEYAQFAIDLQLETQKLELETRKALLASKAIVDARARFYAGLVDENVSDAEITTGELLLESRGFQKIAAAAWVTGAALTVAPNHLGVHAGATGGMAMGAAAGSAIGGHRLEGAAYAVAHATGGIAADLESISRSMERTEMFRRRRQEWENARDQAVFESEQIDAQLAVHDAQKRVTALQLRQAQEAKKQAEAAHAFLNKRFTNSQLYQWLNGQLSTFYYQAYDATFSLCMAAQACWQFEIADYTTRFVKPAAWKDAWCGLTAGESLKLDLMKMEAAYLARNERKLEIVKTISVKQLPAEEGTNKGWETVEAMLADSGVAEFEITKQMLDDDYPDLYLRRIKRISISLPVTVGPYQDIHATLTQTYSAVEMTTNTANLIENLRASQQIAVSTGVDDDGLFVFNFDDERYLPFEGTGAISRWTLQFSNPGLQTDMIASITDIIVHMRYTAKRK
ncbi:toxin [Pseudomonas sp. CDFA 602]|uniref:Tc toxin subunit A-related protein n=1 Tax=Pseudomonas californiensis TaxID=2829823 RepID=UPI001E653608|nr:neuraminidase-like domain-containing protein [Pseudomonas californiensis]MCD5993406.1 toxin [Pseudomonas californiensis]MCD5998803.1 toxin [Pseudomonas californiensis]